MCVLYILYGFTKLLGAGNRDALIHFMCRFPRLIVV